MSLYVDTMDFLMNEKINAGFSVGIILFIVTIILPILR